MRFSLTSRVLSFDLALFEALDDETQDVRAVAGAPWSADTTIAPTVDALAQADELPGDRRRMGFA